LFLFLFLLFQLAKIIIQDKFFEDDELAAMQQECKDKHKLPIAMVTGEAIRQTKLCADAVVFGDSRIVQELLSDQGVGVPPTYPDCFAELYGRDISRRQIGSDQQWTLPCFIKPATGHKEFKGCVINTFKHVNALIQGFDPNFEVYTSPVVRFAAEFRVYIADFKLAGVCDCSEHRFEPSNPFCSPASLEREFAVFRATRLKTHPSDDFVETVLRLNTYPFVAVDVGLLSSGDWVVVEVNPLFSLCNYGLETQTYVEFCVTAWASLFSFHLDV